MIEFIKPYFDEHEQYVLEHKQIPAWLPYPVIDDFDSILSRHFPDGNVLLTDKGEQAIRLAVQDITSLTRSRPEMTVIAIPSAVCASVYRAVKDFGKVVLMDAGEDWNCVLDKKAMDADIILFASLSGKRMAVPERAFQNQILIDDCAQCYDGAAGFREETDYSIFSFGIGKQMAVGVGGILYSKYRKVEGRHDHLENWQKYLILSQLSKIEEINRLRIKNAHMLIDGLKDLPWLQLPDPKDHVFSKFVVYIDQDRQPRFEPTWTDTMFRFKHHMNSYEIDVEATYVPLHIQFPSEFPDERYADFKVNGLWPEAISLPCRPNLTLSEIDRIIDVTRKFEPRLSSKPIISSKSGKSILCVNHQPVSLYHEQGWSLDRLDAYYNPELVADECLVLGFQETNPLKFSEHTQTLGFNSYDELKNVADQLRPDVIRCYECNQPFALFALDIAKQLGIPSYLSLHDSRKSLDIRLSEYTVITAYTDTLAAQASGILGRPVETQRNGVDSDFFDPQKAASVDWILDHHFVVVTSGRNDAVKNVNYMVDAFLLFKEKNPIDTLMVVIGPGFENYYSTKAVEYIGKADQSTIRDILSCAHLFFQVQLVHEISMAGTEALMMGVPLINGENEESKRLLQWPIGMTVSDPQDVNIMSDYLEYAYYNLKELKEISGIRRQYVIDLFDAEKMRKQEAERYRRLFNI